MRIKKRVLKKVFSVIASILLLVNAFTPYLLIAPIIKPVKAQEETVTPATEITPTETVAPKPTSVPVVETTTPTPTVEVTPTIEETPVEILTPTEVPTLEPTEAPSVPSPPIVTPEPAPIQTLSQWTFENVELNKEYIAPQNSQVKLTFTKLPDPSGNIKIEEITLTEDQIKQTGSLSDKAYDITSDMKDGDFSYNLSFPIPESSKGKAVEVKFAEEISNIGSAEKVDNTLTKTGASVSVASLDHFTIFVVTGTIAEDEFGNLSATYVPDAGSVVINEFVFDPSSGNEWVELYNTSSLPSDDLGGWTIKDRDETNTDITIPSGTVIPANGILVFENNSSGWLDNVGINTNGDTITLRDSGDTIMSQVTYQQRPDGTIFINGQASATTYSGQGQSIGRVINESGISWQAYNSPTKGWFNDAGETGKAPLLSEIDNALNDQGIDSNIGELDNPSNTPSGDSGLYFSRAEGKILFTSNLNLTNQATVNILQSLGQKMEMTGGHIKFDSQTADDMAATGAKIYMYGLSYGSTPDIIIKNDAGEILGTNDPSAVGDISYDPDMGELSFTALHFTQFDLPAAPSAPVINQVTSPTNDTTPTLSWDDVSATPEVTSYDVEIYDSGESSIYDGYINIASSSFTPDDPLPGDDDYTWYVRANNGIGSSEWSEGSFTIDTVAPGVSKLGDGSTDVILDAGDTYLTFSEILSDSSKTAVQNALTAGADMGLTYVWIDNTLVITASETTTFFNDVVVNVFDLAGNQATSLLIVDSSLTTTQASPNGEGNVTANSETPEVVITDPDQEVTVTVDGATDATIDVSSFITDGTGTIPKITINSDNADVTIPATTVTGPVDWDGVIAAPTVTTVTLPETSGETKTLSAAIEIGFTDAKLSFDDAVRILLPGQAGKRAGYSRPGTAFTEITTLCSADTQDAGNALGVDGDCKIDVGTTDMVIWTKHFTKFASYTQTTNSSSTSSSTSSGGGTSTPSAPVCNDTKPGSAPVLSAVAGVNSVTLTWTEAVDPVSYYLAAFGITSGNYTYGNPNIGGKGTTSYTVSGLSGGTTYYFVVRAGNGCAPGSYSNEVQVTPAGIFTLIGPPAGFEAGVLGEATSAAELTPTVVNVSPNPANSILGQVQGAMTKKNNWKYFLFLIPIVLLILYFWRKRSA